MKNAFLFTIYLAVLSYLDPEACFILVRLTLHSPKGSAGGGDVNLFTIPPHCLSRHRRFLALGGAYLWLQHYDS